MFCIFSVEWLSSQRKMTRHVCFATLCAQKGNIWTIIFRFLFYCVPCNHCILELLSWLSNAKNLGFPCFFSGSIASQAMVVELVSLLRLSSLEGGICAGPAAVGFVMPAFLAKTKCKSSVYLMNHRKKKNIYMYVCIYIFFLKGTKKRKLRPIAWIHTHIQLCEKMCMWPSKIMKLVPGMETWVNEANPRRFVVYFWWFVSVGSAAAAWFRYPLALHDDWQMQRATKLSYGVPSLKLT